MADRLSLARAIAIFNSTKHLSFSLILTLLYFIFGISFIITYLTLEIPRCQATLNRVSVYDATADCYCGNNLGASLGIWAQIISETSFYQQFDRTGPSLLPSASGISNMSINLANESYLTTAKHLTLSVKSFQPFYQNYLQYLFTNRLTTVVFDIFEFDDPLHLGLPVPASHPLFNNTCGIDDNYYRTPAECLAVIKSYRADFISTMILSYELPLLKEFCDLDYCEVAFCPAERIWSMIAVVVCFMLILYVLFKLIHFGGLLYFARREEEQRKEKRLEAEQKRKADAEKRAEQKKADAEQRAEQRKERQPGNIEMYRLLAGRTEQ